MAKFQKGNTVGKQFQKGNKAAEVWTEEIALKLGKELVAWLKESDTNIFYEEFLVINRDLAPQKISELSNKFKSFKKLIDISKKIQEIKLTKWGTADKLNASMTKFIMINNHGYKSEKQVIDHTTGGEPIKALVDWGEKKK